MNLTSILLLLPALLLHPRVEPASVADISKLSTVQVPYLTCTNGAGHTLADFTCPSTTTCLWTAANTTLVCCPIGYNCNAIVPITCDLTQQDVSKHPDAAVKTTVLNGTLLGCGEGTCCPWGYECADTQGSHCQLMEDQDVTPTVSGG